jgi:hypothetical protein
LLRESDPGLKEIPTMFMTRWFTVAAVVGVLGVACSMLAAQERGRPGARAAAQHVQGVLRSVDASKGTVVVNVNGAGRGEVEEKTFTVPKDADVAVGAGTGRRLAALRQGKLADFAPGALVTILLAADGTTVESVIGEGPTVRGVVKSVDAEKRGITIATATRGSRERGEAPAEETKTYTLAPKAEIALDDGRGRTFSVKEAKISELPQGALVTLRVSVDQKDVFSVLAEGPSIAGIVKAVDAGKNTLTLAGRGAGRGEDAGADQTFEVSPDAEVLIDDGKGRLLSIKEAKLGDLIPGVMVMGKLSPDQKQLVIIRGEGPQVGGVIKSVDAGKRTLTFEGRKARGDTPEEEGKTYTIARDARILIDGKDSKLADIKPDGTLAASLKLSLDQKVAQSVHIGTGAGRR